MHRVETGKNLEPWSSIGVYVCAEDQDCETVGTVKQPWESRLLYIYFSGLCGFSCAEILIFELNMTLQVNANNPPNNKDFNQGILHL